MTFAKLTGLVTATHTPFQPDGSLHLPAVDRQAAHLLEQHITTAFIGGSTGESHSLTCEERLQLAARWLDVTRGTPLQVIVHVGSNCLTDAARLARHAQQIGARAVAALAPGYFKPPTVDTLVRCCRQIAGAAPETPFYFYDIPALTGVNLPMPDFLQRAADAIPSFAGIKYTNPDLIALQECLRVADGAFDILWGTDECLLSALTLGVTGAVGSTYNFAAPIARRILAAFDRSDLPAARASQFQLVQLVRVLAPYGYLGASKALMQMLGVELGPPRLPLEPLNPEQQKRLQTNLESLGYFNWIQPARPHTVPA